VNAPNEKGGLLVVKVLFEGPFGGQKAKPKKFAQGMPPGGCRPPNTLLRFCRFETETFSIKIKCFSFYLF
jgi:hypothetical protein